MCSSQNTCFGRNSITSQYLTHTQIILVGIYSEVDFGMITSCHARANGE